MSQQPSPSSNQITSRDYERLVHSLVEQEIGRLSGVEVIEISHNVLMRGLSGYEHQIDVMYRIKLWLSELLVLVECKQYEKRVGVDDLLEFKSRIDDLRAHKGVFVTSSGYQSGAIEFAQANRIALLVIKGTIHRAVAYSLTHVPLSEQCRKEVHYLREEYKTETLDAGRISTDEQHVIIQHDGVSVQLVPGELHTSMLYRSPSVYHASAEVIFFKRDHFPYLPVSKILKSLVIDEILTK